MRTRLTPPSQARRRWPAVLLAAFAFVTWLLTGPVVWATAVVPVDAGDITLADAGDPSRSVDRGDGNTAFLVRLPQGASCPGDSFHDQWRVQSFMVPAGADIGALAYGVIGPEGTDQYALFGADFAASSFANMLTPANAVAGQPGRIEAAEAFSFAVVAGESLPTGSYRIGIACTYFRATDSYWDAEIIVSESVAADPDQFRWRLAGAPEQAPEPADDGVSVWLGLVALVVVAAALWFLLRNLTSHRTPSSRKETK